MTKDFPISDPAPINVAPQNIAPPVDPIQAGMDAVAQTGIDPIKALSELISSTATQASPLEQAPIETPTVDQFLGKEPVVAQPQAIARPVAATNTQDAFLDTPEPAVQSTPLDQALGNIDSAPNNLIAQDAIDTPQDQQNEPMPVQQASMPDEINAPAFIDLDKYSQLQAPNPGMRIGDIVHKNGDVFKAKQTAQAVAKKSGKGWVIVPSNQGYVVRFRPQTDKQIAATAKRVAKQREVRPGDSMLQAISKLGGINSDELVKDWGVSLADLRNKGSGVFWVATKGGMSADRMADSLKELEFISADPVTGKHDLAEMMDAFQEEARGGAKTYANTSDGGNIAEQYWQYQNDGYDEWIAAKDAEEVALSKLSEEAQTLIGEWVGEQYDRTQDEYAKLDEELAKWEQSGEIQDRIPEFNNEAIDSRGRRVAQQAGEFDSNPAGEDRGDKGTNQANEDTGQKQSPVRQAGTGSQRSSDQKLVIDDNPFVGKNISEQVKEAKKYSLANLVDKNITNESDNLAIKIPFSGIKHTLSGNVSPVALAAVKHLDDIIKTAVFVKSEADKKQRNTIKEIRFYDREVSFINSNALIRVVVRVAPDGARFYDHFEVKEKAPAGQSGEQNNSDSIQPFTEASSTNAGNGNLAENSTEFNLQAQTQAVLKAAEEAKAAAEKAKQEADRAAEARAQADAEVGQFNLTGSDREADVAAAQGQQDLLAETPSQNDLKLSQSQSTQAIFESRIDELFNGGKANLNGVHLLDKSDVLDMLGLGNMPVQLDEAKVILNQTSHPEMTAEVWKKIPEWLDNPALVTKSRTVQGRYVIMPSEAVLGAPVRIIIEPKGGSVMVHALINAYTKNTNPELEIQAIARNISSGNVEYVDKKKASELLGRSGLQLPRLPSLNSDHKKILTEKNLSGYRKLSKSTRTSKNAPSSTVDEVKSGIKKVYGKLLTDLEKSGLVVVVQSEQEVIDLLGQESASKLQRKQDEGGQTQGLFDPVSGVAYLIADNLTNDSAPGVLMHEIGVHMAGDNPRLFNRADSLVKGGKGEFFDRVRSRMKSAGETSPEEAAAYLVEEYEKDRALAPKSISDWAKSFLAAIRAWLNSKGVLSTESLTVADIAAVARANARKLANGTMKSSKAGEVQLSKIQDK